MKYLNSNFVNLCPHPIKLNGGEVFETSDKIARVSATFTEVNQDGICDTIFGNIENLPEKVDNTYYIVSSMVLSVAKAAGREDCVAPATGHPDCIRSEKGFVVSVPCFTR